jgi:hypothetical protein
MKSPKEEAYMDPITQAPLSLNEEEGVLLAELLESAQARLLVEIRHTSHRTYKDELRRRLDLIQKLLERTRAS